MRHISLDGKTPDQDWLDKADQLLKDLKAAPDKAARAAIIDSNSAVWGELKEWLLSLSHQKCWFSEAKDCFSHWDVEHYRPKKTAKDLDGTEHDCYWWLAFQWTNFRICGNVGNRKKGTFFPLRDGSVRLTQPDDDPRYEHPHLLDPADPDDPNLLSFNMAGEAITAPGVTDAWERERVQYSIERLRLDFPPLADRRKMVWSECWTHIEKYRSELETYCKSNGVNMIAFNETKTHARNIRAMMKDDRELSSVARACVLSTGDQRVIQLLQSA